MRTFSIVLADDEPQILHGMLGGIPWEQLGFSVAATAGNGQEALEYVQKLHPDLLISDIKMPFLDGLELARILHDALMHIKIVLFSGWDDFEYARRAISYGVSEYVLKPIDFEEMQQLLSKLHAELEEEYDLYDAKKKNLFSEETIQEVCLGLHSMCQGAEAQFFNGHTHVTSSRFIVFGVKGLLQASKNVRGAMLFNILSYMSDRLLTIGNTTAVLDELYVWLSDNITVGTTIIEYIRNILKRVRKKESNLIMASQNLEDFDREGIRELTKPLFAIPPHQFIFNCGSIDKRFYMDLLQLEEAEYNLIRFPQRGVCLFKCGNERYLLEVHAPAYKEALYGSAGGR